MTLHHTPFPPLRPFTLARPNPSIRCAHAFWLHPSMVRFVSSASEGRTKRNRIGEFPLSYDLVFREARRSDDDHQEEFVHREGRKTKGADRDETCSFVWFCRFLPPRSLIGETDLELEKTDIWDSCGTRWTFFFVRAAWLGLG